MFADSSNAEWDRKVSSFILQQACSRGAGLLLGAEARSKALTEAIASDSAQAGASTQAGASIGASGCSQRYPTPLVDSIAPEVKEAARRAVQDAVIEVSAGMTSVGRQSDGRRVEDREDAHVIWSLERLQAYMAHVKVSVRDMQLASSA